MQGIELSHRGLQALAKLPHLARLALDARTLGLHHHHYALLSSLTSLTALEVRQHMHQNSMREMYTDPLYKWL